MHGSRGSVRDACSIVVEGQDEQGGKLQRELVMTAGCDRILRLYDSSVKYKMMHEVAHVYLKQRLNSLWLPQDLSGLRL